MPKHDKDKRVTPLISSELAAPVKSDSQEKKTKRPKIHSDMSGITTKEILTSEKQRIKAEIDSPGLKITSHREFGSIDSLMFEDVSRFEKIEIYVNLLRYLGTVREAKAAMANNDPKEAALVAQKILGKMNFVLRLFGSEEDMNPFLLNLLNRRMQHIGEKVIKVLPDAKIPSFKTSIKDAQNILEQSRRNKPST